MMGLLLINEWGGYVIQGTHMLNYEKREREKNGANMEIGSGDGCRDCGHLHNGCQADASS